MARRNLNDILNVCIFQANLLDTVEMAISHQVRNEGDAEKGINKVTVIEEYTIPIDTKLMD